VILVGFNTIGHNYGMSIEFGLKSEFAQQFAHWNGKRDLHNFTMILILQEKLFKTSQISLYKMSTINGCEGLRVTLLLWTRIHYNNMHI
jgi:hypothetical protein